MTTIVGTSECIVADSRCADGDQTWEVEKVERISGGLYAAAGTSADGEKFFAWIRRARRGKKPEVHEDFAALALTKDGLFLYDSELHPMRLAASMAIGSGAKAARGAMAMGADPVQAVKVACEIDAGSSPPVRMYWLNEVDQ